MSNNVIWKPQEKQQTFMARFEDEALYGGAAGGGKSDALLVEALRQVNIANYRGLILRKTMPQCSELIDRSYALYKAAFPYASYNVTKNVWNFPSGAKIYFGSMHNVNDKLKYQGKQYDFIAFDEATHFTWDEYSYMFSRNRPSGKGTRCYMRATTNPGGVGHNWVKKRFIDGKIPMKTYWESFIVDGVQYKKSLVFVPSTVFDNKILLANNPNYIANLASLPEGEKKALLYGDWNSFNGQVFSEFTNNTSGYYSRQFTNIIKPFEIPRGWRKYRSFDFGYAKPFAVQWWAVDYDGRCYLYRQLYGSTGEPNVGVKWEPSQIAKRIRKIEEENEFGCKITGIADPSIWDASRGFEGTIINMFEREGVYFERGDNARIAGKMQLHYRLCFDDLGYPMMYVFDNCEHFIRTISSLVYDKVNVEDVNSTQEDHDYDACRYFLMTNPIKPRISKKDAVFSPLDN